MIILVFLTGLITKSYMGRKLVNAGDRLFAAIPFLRNIYQPTKQVVDSLFSDKVRNFRKVVLVEFPRKGVFAIGFVTGNTSGEADERTNGRCINVFVPTTPNPTSGYYIMVPEKELIDMDMTVEEAIKIIISSGLVAPQKSDIE